jgi:hypothetical protein
VRKYASKYEQVEDDSTPVEVRKYKRMKVGVNALLRAYQKEVGLKKTRDIIMQLIQHGSLTKPPLMKELKRVLSEMEYTFELLSLMMASDTKESEDLIEEYNKQITIIGTITKQITDGFNEKKEKREKTKKEKLEEKRVRNIPAVTKLTSPKRKY